MSEDSSSERLRRLRRWALQSAARELMPRERVSWCFRRLSMGHNHVSVYYSPSVQRAHYKNLIVCGSVWMCPICSAKISERRRVELTTAVDQNPDLQPALVTFTLQHNQADELSKVLAVLIESYRELKHSRHWNGFVDDYELAGSVRSLETTVGRNGWHPHLHVLAFFKAGISLDGAETFFKDEWERCLKKFDRSASYKYGVDFRTKSRDVAEYITKFGHEPKDKKRARKWSMEHEVTKSQSKLSRDVENGRSPLQLLNDFLDGDLAAGRLWREYATYFKGRRQLVWSRGLREKLGLGCERSDEEIAKRAESDAYMLAMLPLDVWKIVLKRDVRGHVLEVASTGDPVKLMQYLMGLGVDG